MLSRFVDKDDVSHSASVRELALEEAAALEMFDGINWQLATLLKATAECHEASPENLLLSFTSLPLGAQSTLVEKALNGVSARSRGFSKPEDTEGFLSLLAEARGRYQKFRSLISEHCISRSFIKALVEDAESVGSFSSGHESLFDTVLGLSNVDGAESALSHSKDQRIWKGAHGGRYAYSSSLARLSRFYGSVPIEKDEIVYDLGSGYGQALFYGAAKYPDSVFKGVEYVSSRVEVSERARRSFEFENISFFAADAREINFSDGTVFYLYSPFTKEIKVEVFRRLVELGKQKRIRLYVYDTDHLGIFQEESTVFERTVVNGGTEEIFESFPR